MTGRFFQICTLGVILIGAAISPAAAQWSAEAEACFNATETPQQGVLQCTAAIEAGGLSNANLALTYANRASSFHDMGQFDRALTDYDAATGLDPENASILSNRATTRLAMGDYGGALSDLNHAIALNPEDPVALTNRCWVHALEIQYVHAHQDCSAALALDDSDPVTYASRAFVAMQLGDVEGAKSDGDAAVNLGPGLWEAHFYRGLAYEMAGDLGEATASYRTAAELAPNEPRILEKLAQLGL